MQTEGKMQTANFKCIVIPFPLLRARHKQVNRGVIEANGLSDIEANLTVGFHFD